MRRLIAYIAMTSAMLVGVGVATSPTILKTDTDLTYSEGQTLYFKTSLYDPDSNNGSYQDFTDKTNVYNDEYIVDLIADEMRSRLDGYGISGYQVETQGYDTIAVSLRTPGNSSRQYDYVSKYLSFSGQDYELDASNVAGDGDNTYTHNEKWEDIIDGQKAWVENIEIANTSYTVPEVIVPLKSGDEYKQAFLSLLEYIGNLNKESESSEEEGSSANKCSLVIWANREDGDTYEAAMGGDGVEANPNIASKIVGQWSVADDQCVYYKSGDDDKTTPYLKLVPALSAEQYDPSMAHEAYENAFYLCSKLNASSYEYGAEGSKTKYQVTYTYSETAKVTVENLSTLGWNRSVSLSKTTMAMLICVAFLAVVLGLLERMTALVHLSSMGLTCLGTLAVFNMFGAQFNIAGLIGLAAVALISLFGTLFQSSRLKDELYKGRTLKKANTEAAKRSLLPIVDAGVLAIIIGAFVYALAGDVASKAGVMLVVGGFFSIVCNLLISRLGFWLLCNDSTAQSAYPKLLGINKDKVPNLLKEEKQSYYGPYADKDFSKGKKWVSILTGVAILAGIGMMIGFGVANNGNVYNSSAYSTNSTILRIDVEANSSKEVNVIGYSEAGEIYDENGSSTNPTDTLHKYAIDGKTIGSLIGSADNFTVSADPKAVYTEESGSIVTTYVYYYEAKLSKTFDLDENGHEFTKWNGTSFVKVGVDTLYDFALHIQDEADTSGKIAVSFANVRGQELTPYLWQVSLGLGVGLAVCAVYLILRYRPSRGLALGLVATATSYLSVAFFVIFRISTAPVVALGAPVVALVAMLIGIYLTNGESDAFKENHDRDKDNLAFRSECINTSASRSAGNILVFTLVAWYVAIVFFAFGPLAFNKPFLAIIIGVAFALALTICFVPTLAITFAKLFSKIKFKPRKKKKSKGGELMKKKGKGSEPVEAIFIGIND